MIILFGRKGCKKTFIEKHSLEASGIKFKYYDIDTVRGKEELRKRGISYKEIRKDTPWMFGEKN